MPANFTKHISLVLFSALVVVWALWYLLWWYLPGSTDSKALLGDYYATLNTLISGLAFAALTVTILLQKKELGLQREELKLTREELSLQRQELEGSKVALLQQAESMRKTVYLQTLPVPVVNVTLAEVGKPYRKPIKEGDFVVGQRAIARMRFEFQVRISNPVSAFPDCHFCQFIPETEPLAQLLGSQGLQPVLEPGKENVVTVDWLLLGDHMEKIVEKLSHGKIFFDFVLLYRSLLNERYSLWIRYWLEAENKESLAAALRNLPNAEASDASEAENFRPISGLVLELMDGCYRIAPFTGDCSVGSIEANLHIGSNIPPRWN